MTVAQLREWLKDKPNECNVRMCIETEYCEYDAPLNDCAIVNREDDQGYVVLIYERSK